MNSSFITTRPGLQRGTTPEGMTYSEAPHRQAPLIVAPIPEGMAYGEAPHHQAWLIVRQIEEYNAIRHAHDVMGLSAVGDCGIS